MAGYKLLTLCLALASHQCVTEGDEKNRHREEVTMDAKKAALSHVHAQEIHDITNLKGPGPSAKGVEANGAAATRPQPPIVEPKDSAVAKASPSGAPKAAAASQSTSTKSKGSEAKKAGAASHQPEQREPKAADVAKSTSTKSEGSEAKKADAARQQPALWEPKAAAAAKASSPDVSKSSAVPGPGGIADVTMITRKTTKVTAKGKPKEPCLEWLDGDIRVEIKVLDSRDDRLSVAPHLFMTPTAFSTPSYFERPCTIGSPEPTTQKCAAELRVIETLRDQIEITIKRAQKEGKSVNETLRAEFTHSLCVDNMPWRAFIQCHCEKCSPELNEIPYELSWRDTWNMVGMCNNFEPGRNLCPQSAPAIREEEREQIALDDLFRTAWNTEMGKVLEEHRASFAQRERRDLDDVSPRNATSEGEMLGTPEVQENEEVIPKAGTTLVGTHRVALLMQTLVTIGAVFFSFFMYIR